MSRLNWTGLDGGSFESLMQTVLCFVEPDVLMYGRPGRDLGQDAVAEGGAHVYQAKWGRNMTMREAIRRARVELGRIRKIRRGEGSPEEIRHWKDVKRWTLVANFLLGPGDVEKWKSDIVVPYADLDLMIDYWSIERLEALLTELPYVERAYFEGGNRCFASMREVHDDLCKGICGDAYFASEKLLGRDAEMKRIRAFLESESDNCLLLEGDPGVGKTRCLYEAALEASARGVRVLWGLVYSLGISDSWLQGGVVSFAKTLIVVDNLSDLTLACRIGEQRGVAEWKSCKFLINLECANRSEALAGLRVMDGAVMRLNPLSEEMSTSLLKTLLPKCPDEIAEQLCNYGRGMPASLVLLAVESRLGPSGIVIADDAVETIKQRLDARLSDLGAETAAQCRMVWRWLSAWKTVSVGTGDGSAIWSFLSGELQLPKERVWELVTLLVEHGCVTSWGIERKVYAVESVLVRAAVICDWLFEKQSDGYVVLARTQELLGRIVTDVIPASDRMFENLVQTASLYLSGSRRKGLLAGFFDKAEDLIRTGGLLQQGTVISWLSRVGYADCERSLDVVRMILKNQKADEVRQDPVWGAVPITQNQVYAYLPQLVGSLAARATEANCERRVWQLFRDLHLAETGGFLNPQDGCRTLDCVRRLVTGLRTSVGYLKMAADDVQASLDRGEFGDWEVVVATSVLNPVREDVCLTTSRRLSYRRGVISTKGTAWQVSLGLREYLFGKVVADAVTLLVRMKVWRVLKDAHFSWRFVVTHHEKISEEDDTAFNKIVEDDLERLQNVVSEHGAHMSQAELLAARDLWSSAVDYPKDARERELANGCEDALRKLQKWPFHEFFRWDVDENVQKLVSDVVRQFCEAEEPEPLRAFFADAANYLLARDPDHPDADCGRMSDLAEKCQGLYSGRGASAFDRFVDERLSATWAANPLSDAFVVYVLRGWLRRYKADHSEDDIAQEMRRLFGHSPSSPRFFCAVYAGMPARVVGTLTRAEWTFCTAMSLSDDELMRTLPTFLRLCSDEVRDRTLSVLNACRNDARKVNMLWRTFAKWAYYCVLRDETPPEANPIRWMIEFMVEVGLDGGMLEDPDLIFLAEKGKYRMTLEEFVAFTRGRVELEKAASRPYENFEVLSHGFDVAKWISPGDEEHPIFQLCEMVVNAETFVAAYRLPECLSSICPAGQSVAKYVGRYLTDHDHVERKELSRLASLASSWEDETDAWRQIAMPICKRVQDGSFTAKEKWSVYESFRNGLQVWSGTVGEVSQHFIDKAAIAKALLDKEPADSALHDYRQWFYEKASRELLSAREEAEDERHE